MSSRINQRERFTGPFQKAKSGSFQFSPRKGVGGPSQPWKRVPQHHGNHSLKGLLLPLLSLP